MPAKALATNLISRKLSRNAEIMNIMINDGRITPRVEATAPKNPFFLNPT